MSMLKQQAKARAVRQKAKARFRAFRAVVSRALNEADPLGLLAMGAPANEYEPEVGTILPRLREVASAAQVRTVVHEEFVRWFGEGDAGPRQRYDKPAKAIWAFLKDGGAV